MSKSVQKLEAGSEYGDMKAILPDGVEALPDSHWGGYHGTKDYPPDVVFDSGIPGKGQDRRLLEHCNGNPQSAFRGSNIQPLLTPDGPGAVLFADLGGWVYEIEYVPTWDTVKQLDGRVQSVAGYAGCPTREEQEFAIPALINSFRVVRVAPVVQGRGTRLKVGTWQSNPRF